jgi:hypothetical protein
MQIGITGMRALREPSAIRRAVKESVIQERTISKRKHKKLEKKGKEKRKKIKNKNLNHVGSSRGSILGCLTFYFCTTTFYTRVILIS